MTRKGAPFPTEFGLKIKDFVCREVSVKTDKNTFYVSEPKWW